MAERRSATLEQRVAVLEGELRRANERIRAFEYWRRRATRQWTLIFSGVVSLLLVLGWVAPTPGAGPASAKAPFRVVNGAGTTILEVLAGKQGGLVEINSNTGRAGVEIGVGQSGGGAIALVGATGGTGGVPDQEFLAGIIDGRPKLELLKGVSKTVELAGASDADQDAHLVMFNKNANQVADFGSGTSQNGFMALKNEKGATSVEAGTDVTGRGFVTAATAGHADALTSLVGPRK
ncbi:MAG TPA: hypothetical protein VKV57_05955 [bacterium]|nr:hypothetical protein [bacterium]